MSYRYEHPPQDEASMSAYLRRQFQRLARVDGSASDALYLTPLSASPAKLKVGMVVYADGVNWNPLGSPSAAAEGVYVRKSTVWKFLG